MLLRRSVFHNQFLITRKYDSLFNSPQFFAQCFYDFTPQRISKFLLPFSSYCCGNVVEFSHVPTLIPHFVQCVTGLFCLLLACSLLVPLVTGLFCLFRVLVTSTLAVPTFLRKSTYFSHGVIFQAFCVKKLSKLFIYSIY